MTELDLGNDHRLARVRDLFLIGAYTGLRYSDFISLTPNNLIQLEGEEVFEVHTVKTNDQLYIPTHPIVLDILKHHGGPPKPLSNQKLNKYLKELCRMIGLNETVTKRTYKGGVRREEHYKKWELVSSHTARRSFATNAYKEKMDAIAIMKITGHKQYDTFMKYIKVDKKENAVRMAGHPYFKKARALPYSLNVKATSK
jgi:integrase